MSTHFVGQQTTYHTLNLTLVPLTVTTTSVKSIPAHSTYIVLINTLKDHGLLTQYLNGTHVQSLYASGEAVAE